MIEKQPWLPAALVLTLITLALPGAYAEDPDAAATDAYLAQAAMAMQAKDYRKAAVEYRKAAEAGSSTETAGIATRLAFAYRFNDESLRAARRGSSWIPTAMRHSCTSHKPTSDWVISAMRVVNTPGSSNPVMKRRVTDCCRSCVICRKRMRRRMPTS